MPRRPPAVARVLERVTATAREHDMFSAGDRVLVAASGGPDSTCLLYSLWHLRRLFRIRLEVFHFDHRLRPDSGKDAQYVRRTAARLKVPFHLRVAEDAPARGVSVEDWAHTARWNAANLIRREDGFATVALGHTLDDQAETVLIALLRGGGLQFVSGMRPKEGRLRVHPLIEVRRTEVEDFCRALGLRPRRDPSNRDRRFLRNALRHEGIPALERATGRDVKGPIARSAALLGPDADELFGQAAKAYAEMDAPRDGIPAGPVLSLPPAIASRVVKLVAWQLAHDPGREEVRAILDLARGRPGRRRALSGGLIAVRDREYVRLSRTSPGVGDEAPLRAGKGNSDGSPARTARRTASRGTGRGAGRVAPRPRAP
ncbi:MAG TPA: tRNA lysidine(34) synthetase TilS [Actinomycetota bacterium]